MERPRAGAGVRGVVVVSLRRKISSADVERASPPSSFCRRSIASRLIERRWGQRMVLAKELGTGADGRMFKLAIMVSRPPIFAIAFIRP